jgi:hypothetical protein
VQSIRKPGPLPGSISTVMGSARRLAVRLSGGVRRLTGEAAGDAPDGDDGRGRGQVMADLFVIPVAGVLAGKAGRGRWSCRCCLPWLGLTVKGAGTRPPCSGGKPYPTNHIPPWDLLLPRPRTPVDRPL